MQHSRPVSRDVAFVDGVVVKAARLDENRVRKKCE